MANLRRHFHFNAKSSQEPYSFPHFSKVSQCHFDKHSFMNDICNCLDLCCSYIQALNSLCGAGSNLARNLFHTVQAVPAYHTVSQQFLSVWEDISKVTASASAAVKTETLMMLQEILNSLEGSTEETDMDNTISQSFQVIGTCLYSFIELQAQFSWSTWKSLSKLTKHCSNDSLKPSLQWRSLDRSSSKMFMNNHLNSNIKKHFSQLFCKVGLSKMSESADTSQSHFDTSVSAQKTENAAVYSPFRSEDVSHSKDSNCVWSTSSTLWPSSDQSSVQFHGSSESTEKMPSQTTTMPSDLDEVINLLSCTPSQQSSSNLNHENCNYIPYSSNSGPMYHFLHDSVGLTHSRTLGTHNPWTKENKDLKFGHDSWIWRVDNMNCSGLPSTSEPLKLLNRNSDYHWKNKELQRWNSFVCETGNSSDDGSSAHGQDAEALSNGNTFFPQHLLSQLSYKRHNSGESMPGGLENASEVKENFMETCSKISTWPLKHSAFKHAENQSRESQENSKSSNLQFGLSYA